MEMKLPRNGTTVTVTLTSGHSVIGELINHKKEPPAIALENVRPSSEEAHTSGGTLDFGELWIECHRISKLEEVEENASAMTSSLVCVNNDDQATDKANGRLTLSPVNSGTISFNWITGQTPIRVRFNEDSQRQLSEPMQNYCKMLFDNSDFTRLLSPAGTKRENFCDIGLPRYFLNFHRELRPLIRHQESSPLIRHQESSSDTLEVENGKAEENAKAPTTDTQEEEDRTPTSTSVGQLSPDFEGTHIVDQVEDDDSPVPDLIDHNPLEENEFPSNAEKEDF